MTIIIEHKDTKVTVREENLSTNFTYGEHIDNIRNLISSTLLDIYKMRYNLKQKVNKI